MDFLIPAKASAVGEILAPLSEFWEHWGFESWSDGPFRGVFRQQRFVKEGILGPVAEYKARECIVWESGTEEDRRALWKRLRPIEDVMTQRFVFILEEPWPDRRIKSFFAGLRGYAEFYAYFPTEDGGRGTTEIGDLTGLINMGIRYGKTGRAAGGAGA